MSLRIGGDRQQEALHREFGERDPLNALLWNSDSVERDIDRPGLLHDGIEVASHGLLVERVDLRRLGRSTGSRDLLRKRIDGAELSSSQKDTRAFASER